MTSREDAVSEAIGGVLLIALVLIGAALVGTFVASQPLPEKIPKIQFSVKEYDGNILLEHEGGESLNSDEFDIVVDGVRLNGVFDMPDGSLWQMGDRISISGYAGAKSVGLVYRGGSGETLLRAPGSPWGFEYSFPAPDPDEVVDVPPPFGSSDWSFTVPDTEPPWELFGSASDTTPIYVAASDSIDFSIVPANATLFRCDGDDDEREINDAIAMGAGGKIELLDGNFRCHGRIILRDDTTLFGQGSLKTTVEITAKGGGTGYLPVTINANRVNVGGFFLRGDGFVMVTKSQVRVRDILATSIDLAGTWHEASGNGMFFVWVASPEVLIEDVEFYQCHATWCHTHGFNMNQNFEDRVVRTTKKIRFLSCSAYGCGYGRVGDPGVMEGNQSRSEWITGFDLHEWQDLVDCQVTNCYAIDNWESGFHLEPGARYTDPPGPWTVSKNVVFTDCVSMDNGQRNTYSGHFFMSGFYLSRDTHLYGCNSTNNRNSGFYVHGGSNSSFEGCTDDGSTYGWKVCKASSDISIEGCESKNNKRWALWLSFSDGISVGDFKQTNVAGDLGYQSILGWYKDEAKYQLPVTNSHFDITAVGSGMPIINQAGSGNTYDLKYG